MIGVDLPVALSGFEAVKAELRALIDQLGAGYEVVYALPDEASHRLTWLAAGGRDFLQVTDENRDEVARAVQQRFDVDMREGRMPGVLPAFTVGAQALRALHVGRLETSGGELSMDPLTPKYAARKARAGQDPRTGVATETTLRALRAAQVIVRRRR